MNWKKITVCILFSKESYSLRSKLRHRRQKLLSINWKPAGCFSGYLPVLILFSTATFHYNFCLALLPCTKLDTCNLSALAFTEANPLIEYDSGGSEAGTFLIAEPATGRMAVVGNSTIHCWMEQAYAACLPGWLSSFLAEKSMRQALRLTCLVFPPYLQELTSQHISYAYFCPFIPLSYDFLVPGCYSFSCFIQEHFDRTDRTLLCALPTARKLILLNDVTFKQTPLWTHVFIHPFSRDYY